MCCLSIKFVTATIETNTHSMCFSSWLSTEDINGMDEQCSKEIGQSPKASGYLRDNQDGEQERNRQRQWDPERPT